MPTKQYTRIGARMFMTDVRPGDTGKRAYSAYCDAVRDQKHKPWESLSNDLRRVWTDVGDAAFQYGFDVGWDEGRSAGSIELSGS